MNLLGYNYRLTDFQCALGSSQLKRLNTFVIKKRKISKIYDLAFRNKKYFVIPFVEKNIYHSYHLYPLLIDFKKLKINKIDFFHHMKKNKINLQVHYIPIHYQPYYKNKFKIKKGSYPISEKFYENEISLPIYPSLKIKEVNNIIKIINKFFG